MAKQETSLVFLPLGGTGEIGMNCNLYGLGAGKNRRWLMVDLGVTFGNAHSPGINVIMPDIEYIVRRKEQLEALVLTHAHEDHIGAVAHLWPYLDCPIYSTAFTLELLRDKFAQNDIDAEHRLFVLEPDKPLQLGDFNLSFYGLTHSIPEMQAVAIETPLGRVLHTGDWKLDDNPIVGAPSDVAGLQALGKKGVAAMVCDSTNALVEGRTGSEADVATGLLELIASCDKQRVFVSGFASNVARLHSVGAIAKELGREMLLLGRGMWRIYNAAQETGYLQDFPPVLSEREAADLPRNKLLVLCTGSQGEQFAALNRLAFDRFEFLRMGAEDVVIFSSRVIPGNELGVAGLQNRLIDKGVALHIAKDNSLHVSGHPARDELRDLYRWVRPQFAVPVHGEARHIAAHCALAEEEGAKSVAARNGDVVQLLPAPAKITEQVATGRLHQDGAVLLHESESPVAMRQALAQEGAVHIYVSFTKKNALVGEPLVALVGIANRDKYGANLQEKLQEEVLALLASEAQRRRFGEKVPRGLEKLLYRLCGKRPMIEIFINRV